MQRRRSEFRTCIKAALACSYKLQLALNVEEEEKSLKPHAATVTVQEWLRKRRKIMVKIPMGINDGDQLRLRGEGEIAASDGETGDLYVIVHIQPNQLFVREGDDLYRVEMITYPQATLGADISVPTLEGPTVIRVHPGTQPAKPSV